MRRLAASCLVLSVLALANCSSNNPGETDGPVGAATSPIAYGSSDTTHTAVVAVLGSVTGGYTECSGTVVQVKNGVGYVLTAAHCCNHGTPDVVVVSSDYGSAAQALVQGAAPTAPAYAVTAGSAYFDALYDPTSSSPDHDFCMFKFAAPTGTAVIPVAQPGDDGLSLDTAIEHVGFGLVDTDAANTMTPNTGRRTGTAPVNLELTSTVLESSQGGPNKVPGTCEGDSGGPALLPAGAAQSAQTVVATTSYGNNETCAEITTAVDSRVTSETGPGGFITNFLADTPSGTAAPPSCDACEMTAETGTCSSQIATCLNDPACKALNTCLTGCTTQACATSCEDTAGSTATTEYMAAASCITGACSQCTAATSGCGLTTNNAACGTCLDTSCCSEAEACVADTTCSSCITASPAASCATNSLFSALNACVESACATPCASSSSGPSTSTSTSTSSGGGGTSSTGTGGSGTAGSASKSSGCSLTAPSPGPLGAVGAWVFGLLGAVAAFSRRRRVRG